jgi:GTP-binding protein
MSQGSNFVDYVKICCRSGHGGPGSSHLHRDILTSKGGPDGGDGGRGGHVIVKGNAQLWTLLHLKFRKHVIAGDGDSGGSSLRSGKTGRDEILEVPLGTIAKNAETGEVLFEINADGETKILSKGAAVARVTGTLKPLRSKPHVTRSPVRTAKKTGISLN